MKTLYLLLAAFVIAGCSSSADKAPETFAKTSEKGLVAVTLTFDADMPQNDIYRFFFSPESTDKKFIKNNKGKLMVKARIKNARDFNGDFNEKKSYLFVMERDPGKYAFTQYNYLNHIGETGTVMSSKTFAIPFEVKKGETQYIGELVYHQGAEKDSPRITVTDNYYRDIRELQKKYPGIDWSTIVNSTPKSGNTGDGMIEFQ